jgi:hypothetical protein
MAGDLMLITKHTATVVTASVGIKNRPQVNCYCSNTRLNRAGSEHLCAKLLDDDVARVQVIVKATPLDEKIENLKKVGADLGRDTGGEVMFVWGSKDLLKSWPNDIFQYGYVTLK